MCYGVLIVLLGGVWVVLCLFELFVEKYGDVLCVWLMKGIVLCLVDLCEDMVVVVFFVSDLKNCVENVMIVDLLCNDVLWIVCMGIVKVLVLFFVEFYVLVW